MRSMPHTAPRLLSLVMVGGFVTLLGSSVPARAQSRSSSPAANSAKKEIDALNTLWQAAIDAKSAERSAALYASDALFMPPNAPRATGAAIRTAWANMFKTPGVEPKLHPQTVVTSPDAMMAYDVGGYDFTATSPKGPVKDRGKYLVVWKKVNGEWKVAADIFNSDLPAQH